MKHFGLKLPARQEKPRTRGLTILIDNGLPCNYFKDTIKGAGHYIDFVKFGWGTSIVSLNLEEKMTCLKENDVDYFFGGTLFEKFLSQNKLDDFYRYCKMYDCRYIEISNGTLPITNREKAGYISDFAGEFNIFSEVGSKDSMISGNSSSQEWIEYIHEDFEAGAEKVITEAREGGTSGICTGSGDIRFDIIKEIISSGLNLDHLIFEAPNKKMQTCFLSSAGPQVNLANIPFADAIALETLRLGLRSDTFHNYQEERV
ncbi:phosphosulfolactate synthase [Bacillus sp. ISL-45]|uniref:phosphosulfolactate synthase n=1 Tax=Bacillus sp. ISL-45 TaxID=2819128 RepID=UPI001BE9F8F9|nr:phosphosulfolactate synthase [Bacillus sp. ISL-45]MBT2659549.1 phosphosulfolactate synthase [Bacillus sp. ISL-45]